MWLHQPVDPPVIPLVIGVSPVPSVPPVSGVSPVLGVPPVAAVPGVPTPGPVSAKEKHLLLMLILVTYVTVYTHWCGICMYLCHSSNFTVVVQCS